MKSALKHLIKLTFIPVMASAMAFVSSLIVLGSSAQANESAVAAEDNRAELMPVEIVDVSNLEPRQELSSETVTPAEAPVAAPESAVTPTEAPVPPAPPALPLITNVLTGLQIERHIQWVSGSDSAADPAKSSAKISLKISWPGSQIPQWSETDLKELKQALSVVLSIKPEQVPDLRYNLAGTFYETEFILKSGLFLPAAKPEQQKLVLVHPIRIPMAKHQQDGKKNPVGEFRVITRIDRYPGAEHEKDDCRVSSRWITGERLLYKNSDGVVVEDRVLTKTESPQFTGDNAKPFETLKGCSERVAIQWAPEAPVAPTAKSSAEMSKEDEEKLRSEKIKTAESIFKRLKYHRLQRKNNPKDTAALVRQAECYLDLASLQKDGDDAFAAEALEILNAAHSINRGTFDRETYVGLISAKIQLADKEGALKDLTVLQKNAPRSFDARYMSAALSLLDNKFDYAREWAARAAKVANNDSEKQQAETLAARVKETVKEIALAEKKRREQVLAEQNIHIEEMVEYFDAGDYDQALAAAKQALALGDSQEAKEFAGNILDRQIQQVDAEISELKADSRMPASVGESLPAEEREQRLEQLKTAYGDLMGEARQICQDCEPYMRRQMMIDVFFAATDPKRAKSAAEYSEKLLKLNPQHQEALQVKAQLQALSQQPESLPPSQP